MKMGEAKRKRAIMARREMLSRPMSRARFDIFAIGARMSPTHLMSDELSWWSDHDERVLGLVFRDVTDDDFGWILMARDRLGRFRCVDLAASLRSPDYAEVGLRQRIGRAVEEGAIDELGDQADETNFATDLLALPTGARSEDLHPHFRQLLESTARQPARRVFQEIGPWLTPSDPHFVSEFQFTQFDQRLWELYLWAAFREMGYDIRQPEAPDFLCSAPGISFTVEATTCAPSTSGVLADHPNPDTPEQMAEFLANYMPMKFGSSLTSKLNKKNKNGESYWERGETAGKPFILAIADFHISGGDGEGGSMTYTQSALWPYLYGHRVSWEMIDGQLVVRATKGEPHTYRGKTIETGFFDLPGTENISAVLFSNAGTLAKFDRMGVAAGFGPENHSYIRFGYRLDPSPNAVSPEFFSEEVVVDSGETWSDELQLFHNPRAAIPLPPASLTGVTHHFFENGVQQSYSVGSPVLGSRTMIIGSIGAKQDEQVV